MNAQNQDKGKGYDKSRRSFLNFLVGGSLIAFISTIIYPVYRFLTPPKNVGGPVPSTVQDGTVDELKPNSGKIVKFGKTPVILIRTPSGDIRAFGAVCTHLGCIVQYRSDLKQIWCACHNGHYNLNGVNISGPPPRPLAPFKVDIKGDQIFVSKET